MKKRLLAFPLLAGALAASAQTGSAGHGFGAKDQLRSMPQGIHPTVQQGHPADGTSELRTTPFWSEDFSGGSIPAGWTNVDDMTPEGETNVIFQWADDPGAVTAAAANQPLILTFLANGASNGYLWANSDRGLSSAPPSNHLTRLTTGAINCSGQPSVLLTMQSTIGVWDNNANEYCKVRVSTDGVNFTDFLPFPCLTAGGALAPPCSRFSYNPQTVAVDITSAAANQPTIYLQFEWQGGWEYYWAIDDLALSPIPDHEMVMDYGYASTTSDGHEYGRIPVDQMPGTLNVGAEVVNFGSQDQTNVTVEADLQDAGSNSLGTATGTIGTMLHMDTVVTDEDIALPGTMAAGLYSVTFSVLSDQIGSDDDPDNNTKVRNFAVTSDSYGLDGVGVYPEDELVLGQIGTGSFADNEVNLQLLNYFQVNNTYNVLGAQVLLGSSSDAGSLIAVALYDTTDVLAANMGNPLTFSEDHVVTADEIAAGVVNLNFLDPIALPPGGYYLGAKVSKQDENELYVVDDGTVPQPDLAALIYTPVDDQNAFVYTNGNAYGIRLISEPVVSVEETAGLEGVSLYPNPTTGLVHIRTAQAAPTTVEVRNVLGELVKTATFNGMENSLDLRGNAAGLYSVRISNGSQFAVERITLK
jgi:hypothetical protein